MKGLKLASDGALLLALVLLVVAVVTSTRWGYALAGLCLVGSVVLTVLRRRAQKARRAATG